MVLVSFVLVVVAAITLVIGLLQSGLSIIYVSIACSLLAGIVLFTAVLRGRPEPSGATGPAPRPAPQAAPPPQPAPAQQWTAPTPAPSPQPAPEPQPAMSGGAAAGAGAVAVEEREDRTQSFDRIDVDEAVADDDFPIHQYDSLRATEVLPMLAELSDEQLDAVEERERNGKNRAMVLNRIEAQRQSRSEAWGADDEGWQAEPEMVPEPEMAPEPEPEPEPEPAPVGGPMSVRPAPAGGGEFPIPDYDELRALEVLGRLPDLSVAELQTVRRREEDGFRRAMVLNRIDRLIEEAPPEAPPVAAPPRRRAAAGTAKASSRTAKTAAGTAKAAAGATKVAGTRRTAKKALATEDAATAMPMPAAPTRAPSKRAAKAAPVKRAATKAVPAAKRAAKSAKAAATKKGVAPVRKAAKKR